MTVINEIISLWGVCVCVCLIDRCLCLVVLGCGFRLIFSLYLCAAEASSSSTKIEFCGSCVLHQDDALSGTYE